MVKFTKVVASGNDFVIVDNRKGLGARGQGPGAEVRGSGVDWSDFAKKICVRRTNVGADGLLLLENSKTADVKMRVFNPDGGEVEMCGNGSRCVALYCNKKHIKIETKPGILEAELSSKNMVKVKMTDPSGLKLNFKINLKGKDYEVHFINTGVPHVVHFTDDIDNFRVKEIGRLIRYHADFQPAGTNANFARFVDKKTIALRTYERGVEDETLACGTGACASAIIAAILGKVSPAVDVETKSGEVLTVYLDKKGDIVKDVYLEGEARIVFEGGFYV